MEKNHAGNKGDNDFTGDDAVFYNAFHTADYAHELRRRCLMIAMMLHCKWYVDREYTPNWDDREKWTVVYTHNKEEFAVDCSRMWEWNTIYFDTKENAQKCADWMNEHWEEGGNGI
jgi:hypothetical protein